jgi:hypothetical protein
MRLMLCLGNTRQAAQEDRGQGAKAYAAGLGLMLLGRARDAQRVRCLEKEGDPAIQEPAPAAVLPGSDIRGDTDQEVIDTEHGGHSPFAVGLLSVLESPYNAAGLVSGDDLKHAVRQTVNIMSLVRHWPLSARPMSRRPSAPRQHRSAPVEPRRTPMRRRFYARQRALAPSSDLRSRGGRFPP